MRYDLHGSKKDIRRIGDTLFRTSVNDHSLVFLVDHELSLLSVSRDLNTDNNYTHRYESMLDVDDTR